MYFMLLLIRCSQLCQQLIILLILQKICKKTSYILGENVLCSEKITSENIFKSIFCCTYSSDFYGPYHGQR